MSYHSRLSPREGVAAAPGRRRSSINSRRKGGPSSSDEDFGSFNGDPPTSRDRDRDPNMLATSSEIEANIPYSTHSSRSQPLLRPANTPPRPRGSSSKLTNSLFLGGISNREKEYNSRIAATGGGGTSNSLHSDESLPQPPPLHQRTSVSQESVGTTSSAGALSARSGRFRPGNSSSISNSIASNSIASNKGTLESAGGFPRSSSDQSGEQLFDRSPHSGSIWGSAGAVPPPSVFSRDRHRQQQQQQQQQQQLLRQKPSEEDDDDRSGSRSSSRSSQSSNMSDIRMRPSSSIPLASPSNRLDGRAINAFDTDSDDKDDEGEFDLAVGSRAGRMTGSAPQSYDDNDGDNYDMKYSSDYDDIDESPMMNSGWSVSDKSGMSSSNLSAMKDPISPLTPSWKPKSGGGNGGHSTLKNNSWREDDTYYDRIRKSTVSAYNDEDNDDDVQDSEGNHDESAGSGSSSGSEDLDVLGKIPEIFHCPGSRNVSRDEDDDDSHSGEVPSSSDDDDYKKAASAGIASAKALRPQNNKANRPTRKKPPPKPPVNLLLAAKANSFQSNSQLSTNTHSDGGSTVLARHNAHGGSFVSGGLRRMDDHSPPPGSQSTSSVSGGLRRMNNTEDSQSGNNRSSSRISVSGGLRKVENGNNQSSFFGRSMLMLKMFTGSNANHNASMSSVGGGDNGTDTNNSSRGGSSNQLMPRRGHRPMSSQHSLLTDADAAETVYSVNSTEMKNPQTFTNNATPPSSFKTLLEESKSKLNDVDVSDSSSDNGGESDGAGAGAGAGGASGGRDRDSGGRGSDEPREDKVKSEKFQRMMLMKQQYSSRRHSRAYLSKQSSNSSSSNNSNSNSFNNKGLKATSSMAIMIQKANQLEKPRIPIKHHTTSPLAGQTKGLSRKSSAMVMNMQGLGMNMSEISNNLGRTVVRSSSNVSSPVALTDSPRKLLSRQNGGESLSSIVSEAQDDSSEGEDDEEGDEYGLLELDCGPNVDNPILSYKQAQRARAFHMPGLIDAETITLIQHPLNSKFGWYEFPFRKIFAKDPSPSDMVIEKYGIGVILWFRFLKAFAIVFFVMFVVNIPSMSMFYHGTYYPAARRADRIESSPTDILTTTTMGNLGVQMEYCYIVKPGEVVDIDCLGGVVKHIIAYYGNPRGKCSCPSVQQTQKNGNCPGDILYDSSDHQSCEVGRYDKKLACFDGTFRGDQCCGFDLDAEGNTDLSALGLGPDYTCNSLTAQYIASGMCLGKETCTLGTDFNEVYHWEGLEATNLNNSDVCQTGFDSGSLNNSDASFCTTSMGHSGIWDTCPTANTQTLKLHVKCSEQDITGFGAEASRTTIVITASILNAIAVSVFIFAVYWVSKEQEAEEAAMDRSTCRATDYTIRCVRLPDHNSSNELANNLKKHFESKLSKSKPCFLPGKVRVADINLTTGSFMYLQAAILRGKASRALDLVRYKKTVMDYLDQENSWRYKFFEKWEEHALRTFEKYNQICHQKFQASLNGEKKVIIAYVTFETEEGFLRALANNVPIKGKQMSIKRAEDPSDILWENLGTPVFHRLIRRSVTTLLLIVLLLMTYFIVAYAIERSERNSTDWPLIITCDDFSVSLDRQDNSTDLNVITYEKTLRDHKWQYFNNTDGRQGYVNCYCQTVMNDGTVRRALDYHFWNPETKSEERWCKDLLWDEFSLLAIKLAVSMVVLTVNLSAKTILHVLKEFERMASYSLISQSMTLKLFMIQIVNTGMLALLMNGDAGLSKENTVAFMNGDYSDFTPQWYDDIGKTVLQTITLYSIGVHGMKFAVHFLHQFMRWRDRGFGSDVRITKQVSQENLNKLFLGPEFVIEVRYATVLTVCFVCIAYAPAMPLLYLIAGLGFWATYLIDKWFFLRVYRIPQATSPQLAHTVTKSLYVSAILNLLLSIWIYSNVMLFDPVINAQQTEVIVNDLKFLEVTFSFHSYDKVSDRVFSQYALASWVVLVPFVLFLLMLLLTYFMNENDYKGGVILSHLLNLINSERMFEGNPPYFNVIPATLLVRRLDEGVARPHILAAYESQLKKVEAEGEEKKLMEGLESYKIELNEIYADKIALNSDYMSKVRPMDLFADDDKLDANESSFEYYDDEENDSVVFGGDGKDQGASGAGGAGGAAAGEGRGGRMMIKRSATIGRGLSGADYEWVDSTSNPLSPPHSNSAAAEKDIFTLLKEKKQALREWRNKQGSGSQQGDEVKHQSDSSEEESGGEESSGDSDDMDEETVIVEDFAEEHAQALSDCSDATDVTTEHSYYSYAKEEEAKLRPTKDSQVSNPFTLNSNGNSNVSSVRSRDKGNDKQMPDYERGFTDKREVGRENEKQSTSGLSVERHNSFKVAKAGVNPLQRREQDRHSTREREKDRHHARRAAPRTPDNRTPDNTDPVTTATASSVGVSVATGDARGGRRLRHDSHTNSNDDGERRPPRGGGENSTSVGSEKRYYDRARRTDQDEGGQGKRRRSDSANDKSREGGGRSSRERRDKSRDASMDASRDMPRERSSDRRHRDRDREGERRHRARTSSGGGERSRHRERERERDEEGRGRDRDREKPRDERRHRSERDRGVDEGEHREHRAHRDHSDRAHRDHSDREHRAHRDHRDHSDREHRVKDKKKSHRDGGGSNSSDHRREKRSKELQLGFLSASKKTRQERAADKQAGEANRNDEAVENVSESFSNLF